MKKLVIGEALALPHDATTETFAILGKRGSGKTNTAVVLVEEMVAAGLPVAVIDPVGVWWGLRLGADGKSPGLDVILLGGDHGDVPLEETAGAVLADFVVESRRPCVFDLSGLRKGAQVRFMTDFAERLYHLKAKRREPLHLVVDEADAFAPQRAQKGEERLLGAMEDLVRRGRSRGLGLTLITQRPAVLNKNVLTQTECLVVLRLPAPQDRDAVNDWVSANGTPAQRDELLDSLASLPRGTAWFWSPAWLEVFKRVPVRARRTFDSSATPKAGERKATPAELPPVDLGELRTRIAATIEKAKRDDPKTLRARIAELERQLAERPAARVERVEVATFTEDDRRVVEAFATVGDHVRASVAVFAEAVARLNPTLDRVRARMREAIEGPPTTRPEPRARPAPKIAHRDVTPQKEGSSLGKCEREILTVLAQRHPARTTAAQAAILSGYSVRSSTFANALSKLRTSGLMQGGRNMLTATAEGVREAGPVAPLPTGTALLEHWCAELGKCEAEILRVVVAAKGRGVAKPAIAERTGYSITSSSFANAISKLRMLELITRDQEPRAADVFAGGGSA